MYIFFKRLFKFVLLKIKFARKCKFDFSCKISIHSEFEGMNKLYKKVNFSGKMGFGSYIAKNSSINGKIGRFCSIANNVSTNSGIHPYQSPFVSTAPCFFSLGKQNGGTFAKEQLFKEYRYVDENCNYAIEIENDVWICEGVFINPGIRISNGAVILSHAVVTKDVAPYAIVGGVPAKVLGYRYDEDTIKWLLKTQWWNNDVRWFRNHWKLMTDIDKLKEYYNKKDC